MWRRPIDRLRFRARALALLLLAGAAEGAAAQASATFELEEATIAEIQEAFRAGSLTCRNLVASYLARIEAYDKKGPAINAIIATNPWALDVADALDRRFAQSGPVGPLHCVPLIVKDNFDTADMPTTGGSLALAGSIPPTDAFVVRRLREAGAIVLAKSNLHELARGTTTVSSLGGQTRNPYDLTRVPNGSSGGTGAGVAANMGAAGLGTETGRSIRGPAAYNALVGIAPTEGLLSRHGIIPLSATRDRPGPLARTVADAAALLEVMAGYDVADPVTAEGRHVPTNFSDQLDPSAIRGARIGVLRDGFAGPDGADPEVIALIERAIRDLEAQGATMVDPVVGGAELVEMMAGGGSANDFKTAMNDYLARLGPAAPVTSLADIVASGLSHESQVQSLSEADENPEFDAAAPEYIESIRTRRALRGALTQLMETHGVDALVYPMNVLVAQKIGETADAGARFSPNAGLPAVAVPAGFTAAGLPVSIEFLGRGFSEGLLIRLAHAYEQATGHRRPPASAPPLR